MDFSINARLTQADAIGVDLTPLRELRRAQEAARVNPKGQTGHGSILRGHESAQQTAQVVERAARQLEAADGTVHQVEDLLHDTISGFRTNRNLREPPIATERLLRSASEVAQDIVGFARFDEEMLFPPLASPVKIEYRKAARAYAGQSKGKVMSEPPAARAVLADVNHRLRGPRGVLPTLDSLADSGIDDLDATDTSLAELRASMGESRNEISAVVSGLATGNKPGLDFSA